MIRKSNWLYLRSKKLKIGRVILDSTCAWLATTPSSRLEGRSLAIPSTIRLLWSGSREFPWQGPLVPKPTSRLLRRDGNHLGGVQLSQRLGIRLLCLPEQRLDVRLHRVLAWQERSPMLINHNKNLLHAGKESPDVMQSLGECKVIYGYILAGFNRCVAREAMGPVPMKALETIWSSMARGWAGRQKEDHVDTRVDGSTAREFGGCEGATIPSQGHMSRFSTNLKENWRRASGDVVVTDAEVNANYPGSWKGCLPDLETHLGGQLIETLE
jgi:hypothetical protein